MVYFTKDYMLEKDLSKEDSFELGIITSELQYKIRLIKSLERNGFPQNEINDLKPFIFTLDKYIGIGLFLYEKLLDSYENANNDVLVLLFNKNKHSIYFNKDRDCLELEKTFDIKLS